MSDLVTHEQVEAALAKAKAALATAEANLARAKEDASECLSSKTSDAEDAAKRVNGHSNIEMEDIDSSWTMITAESQKLLLLSSEYMTILHKLKIVEKDEDFWVKKMELIGQNELEFVPEEISNAKSHLVGISFEPEEEEDAEKYLEWNDKVVQLTEMERATEEVIERIQSYIDLSKQCVNLFKQALSKCEEACRPVNQLFGERVQFMLVNSSKYVKIVDVADISTIIRIYTEREDFIGMELKFTISLSAARTGLETNQICRLTNGNILALNPRQLYRLAITEDGVAFSTLTSEEAAAAGFKQ